MRDTKETSTKIRTAGTLCFIEGGGVKGLWALHEYKTGCVPKNRSHLTHHRLRRGGVHLTQPDGELQVDVNEIM